ncbi:MAG: ABC transporter ATP-binding protein [Saprospiraceae bacterium]|nr:ABC transporter ATP-binding protein [Saprospiraceae bacterium]
MNSLPLQCVTPTSSNNRIQAYQAMPSTVNHPPSSDHRLFSNPYLNMLATAWKYAGKERKRFLFIYFMFMLSNLTDVLFPIIWGVFINEIQQNGMAALSSAWKYALLYVGIKLVEWGFHGPARIWERELAFNLSRNFIQELYHKALHLPVRWHQDNHSGATINRIRKAYEAMRRFFEQGFEYLHTLFKFAFSFIAMIYFAPIFGLVATALGVLVVWVILKFDKPYIKTLEEVNEEEHKVSSTLFDSLSNIVTVITLRLEQRMEAGLLGKVTNILRPYRRNIRINEWKWFIVDMLVAIIYAVILVGYVWQHWVPGEVFLIGGLVMLMGYVERFTSVFHNVAYLYTDVVQHNTDVTTAFNILEAYEQHHLPEAVNPLPKAWKTLEISNLNFSHREESVDGERQTADGERQTADGERQTADGERQTADGERQTADGERQTADDGRPTVDERVIGLQNLNFKIERGKRIALIGESGSGKSTLLALLRGLYDPAAGVSVLVDGLRQIGFDSISNHVTLFPQEPEIFENTIEYNITLGLPHEPGEIEQICERVGFSDVVAQLPKGLQSNIQEKGVNLSGGQKQRLALARGVFAAKDSDLLLLDEPTSSVDPKTESKIYERLFAEASDKAIVSALHRLHLLPRFDHIYLLENGRVVDEGSFGELSLRSTKFREMWEHQEASWQVSVGSSQSADGE